MEGLTIYVKILLSNLLSQDLSRGAFSIERWGLDPELQDGDAVP
jgi:hypothetical protein